MLDKVFRKYLGATYLSEKEIVIFKDKPNPIYIPSGYAQFNERFQVNEKLFNGFLTKSADKIIESTNVIKTV
jgi:hypothetical protein